MYPFVICQVHGHNIGYNILIENPASIVAFPSPYTVWSAVVGFILTIGVLLVSVGAMKLGKYYRNTISNVAGIIGLITAIFGLVTNILSLTTLFVVAARLAAAIMAIVWIIFMMVFLILLGIAFILLGIAFIIVKDRTSHSGLALGTGIMAIISGTTYIILVGMLILIPTLICAAILFLKLGRSPTEGVKEAKKLVLRQPKSK